MSRELFKSLFRPVNLTSNDYSPMTSLAHNFEGAKINSPCNKLSISSLTCPDTSYEVAIGNLDFDDSTVWQDSPDKENIVAPSRKRRRHSVTPLKSILNQKIVYSPSPVHKKLKQHSAMKRQLSSPDSRDSGFSGSETKTISFMQCLPKPSLPKLDLDSSPHKIDYFESPTDERKFRSFVSISTTIAEEEFLMEVISKTPKPTNFDNLMSAPFAAETPEPIQRLPIRRCLSMIDTTPTGPLAASSPRKDTQSNRFKRPCSPVSDHAAKRRKPNSDCSPLRCTFVPRTKVCHSPLLSNGSQIRSPSMQRSVSDSHLAIMKALNKSEDSEQLTADFSRPLCLPVLNTCRHPELKSINASTMADLLRGKFRQYVESYKIIDCRYPYEFNGGHIEGAESWTSLESASDYFNSITGPPEIAPIDSKRKIIIFHCEFSAERGPKAHRFLRGMDRTVHKQYYPALHFPELYLLEGGYKAFFQLYPELCSPQSYTKMLDSNHTELMKFYRSKSRLFANETKFGKGRSTVSRTKSVKRFEE